MDKEKRARILNKDKSKKAIQGWKKYGANYRRGIRKRERDEERGIVRMKDLKSEDLIREALQLMEAEIVQDNLVKKETKIKFENIPGGIALKVNPELQTVNLSFYLNENNNSNGSYRLNKENASEKDYDELFDTLTPLIQQFAKEFDNKIDEILNITQLNSTK